MVHLTVEALEAGLDEIRRSPADGGRVELIVRRPEVDAREVLMEGWLDQAEGLVGDGWRNRPSRLTSDRSPHPDLQVTVMNARVAALLAGQADRRRLAGDQLYVDLDLSQANLPPGTRLALGSAVIEISRQPHSGCAKFAERFGLEALRFVNSPDGRSLRLRGLNAKVVVAGAVRVGDTVWKVPAAA
jgi:MOSC domain-containing protein YiiM